MTAQRWATEAARLGSLLPPLLLPLLPSPLKTPGKLKSAQDTKKAPRTGKGAGDMEKPNKRPWVPKHARDTKKALGAPQQHRGHHQAPGTP